MIKQNYELVIKKITPLFWVDHAFPNWGRIHYSMLGYCFLGECPKGHNTIFSLSENSHNHNVSFYEQAIIHALSLFPFHGNEDVLAKNVPKLIANDGINNI